MKSVGYNSSKVAFSIRLVSYTFLEIFECFVLIQCVQIIGCFIIAKNLIALSRNTWKQKLLENVSLQFWSNDFSLDLISDDPFLVAAIHSWRISFELLINLNEYNVNYDYLSKLI